jgi:hypothetical protein
MRWAGPVLAVALVLLAGLAAWTIGFYSKSGARSAAAMSRAAFEEATGIEILRVAVTAGGGILDLRYRVLDPDKAVIVHDQKAPLNIIHERTGQTASRPWMPHHRHKQPRLAITYYELLENTGGIVMPGDPVTIVIGPARLAHIIVE